MSARRFAATVLLALGCAAPVAAAGQVTLPFDAQKSSLTFTIRRPGETIDGTAPKFEGDVTFDPQDLSKGGSVILKVQADALETGNRLRDHKMRSTHLEVERFPQIVFKSTSIKVGSAKVLVEGVLSLHGVDRTIMVPATIRYDSGVLTTEGSVDLTYSDFGIPIPRFLWLVMDDVITVHLRLVTGAAPR
jgi:polyisoprenoid-binding protein YceI